MDQEIQQERHILDQVVISTLPPEFDSPDINKRYQDGEFTSRLDAEIEGILRLCQQAVESDEVAPMTLSGEALAAMRALNCIALIQGGQVLPLLDIEQMPTPMTVAQRVQVFHAAARTLLEAIAVIYEDRARRTKSQDDDNEGDCCYA